MATTSPTPEDDASRFRVAFSATLSVGTFGTCFLGGNPMHCEFSGGTGMFTWFHASVVVTVTDPGTTKELWHWAGTYSFTPH